MVLVLEFPQENNVKTLNEESDDNPFAKKKFDFDEKKNVYVCPQKHELTPDGVYDAPPEKGGFHKKKIVYSNYLACQKCPCKSQCTSAKHRTITRYVHELSYEIEKIMDTPEGQKDYEQRSRTVEAHNGTFKRIYKFNELQITGLDNMRGYLFKTAASYKYYSFI